MTVYAKITFISWLRLFLEEITRKKLVLIFCYDISESTRKLHKDERVESLLIPVNWWSGSNDKDIFDEEISWIYRSFRYSVQWSMVRDQLALEGEICVSTQWPTHAITIHKIRSIHTFIYTYTPMYKCHHIRTYVITQRQIIDTEIK